MSLLDRPLSEQAAALASGEADASELLDEVLARIEERNGAVNAVVETFPERSREMLEAAPEGPLRGVPVVIKDEWPLPWRAERFGAAIGKVLSWKCVRSTSMGWCTPTSRSRTRTDPSSRPDWDRRPSLKG